MNEIELLLKAACEAHAAGVRLPLWIIAPTGSGKSRMLQSIAIKNPTVYYYEGSLTANDLATKLLPRLINMRIRTFIFDDLSHISEKAMQSVFEKFQQIADGKLIMNQFEVSVNYNNIPLNIIISCTPEFLVSRKVQNLLKQTGLDDRFLMLNYKYSFASMTRALVAKSKSESAEPIRLNGTVPKELTDDEITELMTKFPTCRQLEWAMALSRFTDIDFSKYAKGVIEV